MFFETRNPKPETRLSVRLIPLIVAALLLPGCARLGERVQPLPLPAGAPGVKEILRDLAAQGAALKNFRATGTFTLESPDLAAVQRFKEGFIAFRRPADLCVIGRKYMGVAVFRLTCVGSEFLIEFPATPNEEPYYRIEGERFAGVPFSVSPSDIAREMFLPENWDRLKPKEVRITGYEADTQTATLEIGGKAAPRRRITVTGPPWRVTRSERLGEDGQILAIATKGEYRTIDGVLFPVNIDAQFPSEQTRMTLEMRKMWPNTELKPDLFDIKARAREAGIDPDRETPPEGRRRE